MYSKKCKSLQSKIHFSVRGQFGFTVPNIAIMIGNFKSKSPKSEATSLLLCRSRDGIQISKLKICIFFSEYYKVKGVFLFCFIED